MIKILNETEAKKIWNKEILSLNNPTYYQSFEYADTFKENEEANFIYSIEGTKKIYGFVKIQSDLLRMPFGPIISSDVEEQDIIKFIKEVSEFYNKKIIFTTTGIMSEKFEKNGFANKIRDFATPIIDTCLPIEEIVKNCNENRRRIIKKGLANIPSENIKKGIEYVDDFYKLYQKRMQETNYPLEFNYDYLVKNLSEPTSDLYVCLDENKVIAGHVVYYFGNTMITRYNSFDSDYAKLSPAARIEFELIKNACESEIFENYDMSGIALENATEKELSINRYKNSYRPTKILKYNWYEYKK